MGILTGTSSPKLQTKYNHHDFNSMVFYISRSPLEESNYIIVLQT